jgi:methionine--tRNA ligase beta chain
MDINNFKNDIHHTVSRHGQVSQNEQEVENEPKAIGEQIGQGQQAEQREQGQQGVSTEYISIDDFAKVEIKIGLIVSAEKVDGSDKLLKLSVSFGADDQRQVLSGIAKYIEAESLPGKKFPFVTNLKPRKMMGMDSQAMILAVNDDINFALLEPTTDIKEGSVLR